MEETTGSVKKSDEIGEGEESRDSEKQRKGTLLSKKSSFCLAPFCPLNIPSS